MERRRIGPSKRGPVRRTESERSGSEDRQIPSPTHFLNPPHFPFFKGGEKGDYVVEWSEVKELRGGAAIPALAEP